MRTMHQTVTHAFLALSMLLTTGVNPASAAEPHEPHAYNLWPIKAAPLPGYLTQTQKDCLMVQVRLQKPGETYRLRVWYTSRTAEGVEVTWERRVDVKPADGELWVTAVFGGYEPGEGDVLKNAMVRVKIWEQSEAPVIAESVSTNP